MNRLVRPVGRCRNLVCRFSTKSIPPGIYHDNGLDFKIREGINNTTLLPSSTRIFPETDVLYVDFKREPITATSSKDPRVLELIRYIKSQKVGKAFDRFESLYHEDPTILKGLTREQCSALLRSQWITISDADESWAKLRLVADAMRDAGHALMAPDLTVLITNAYHVGLYQKVEQYWREAEESGIPKSTAMWNAYIMATSVGHPTYWRELSRFGYSNRESNSVEPPITHESLELFKQMSESGVKPDARTHELLIMSFARKGDLDAVRTILSTVWGEIGDGMSYKLRLARYGSAVRPDASTLANIIHSFALNEELSEGLKYISWLQDRYHVRLNDRKALHMWTVALYWAFADKGSERDVFSQLWNNMTKKHSVQPTPYMFYLYLRFFQSIGNTRQLIEELDHIHSSANVHEHNKDRIAAVYVNRIARLMLSRGSKLRALRFVDTWSSRGPPFEQVKARILQHLETSAKPRRGAEMRAHQRKKRTQLLASLKTKKPSSMTKKTNGNNTPSLAS